MDPIKAIEDAPSFHARVMNISSRGEDAVARSVLYAVGHRDARHAAAELANEADALIRSLLDRLREAEAAIERQEHALHSIASWCEAYPLSVFPEPDFARAHELLTAGGITLDAISASNMRHVVNGIRGIVTAAMKETP